MSEREGETKMEKTQKLLYSINYCEATDQNKIYLKK